MIKRTGIKAAVGIINEHIRNFEKAKEDNEIMNYETSMIVVGMKVLMAATGHTYHWQRFKQPNGKWYSGVCRMITDSDKFFRFENCMEDDD